MPFIMNDPITQPTTPEECDAWNFIHPLSPGCNLVFTPVIEAPPIEGTYIRPPWNGIVFPPTTIIVQPPIETVTPPASVPLPATPLLLLLGFAVLCAVARRK